MEVFLKEDYLLRSQTAKQLYEFAREMPIVDYHCHLQPQEIYEDKQFSTITQLWLGGDHYKWRLMRSAGIEERYITGDASDEEKFLAYAKAISLAIGNPLYEWSHLELKNYFGYNGVLDEHTAPEVYRLANEKLKAVRAREFIVQSRVEVICTTDDPVDDLRYHKKLKEEEHRFRVLPAFRPDPALAVQKAGWRAYMGQLEEASGVAITSFAKLKEALSQRMDHFESLGCKLSDHGIQEIPFQPYTEEEVEAVFEKAIKGETLSPVEVEQYQTALLLELMRQYHRRGWVAQLHYGVSRDNNSTLHEKLGPDCGGDHISDNTKISKLSQVLDALDKEDQLPKTIVYSLNPIDNASIDTVLGSFQKGPDRSKLQHGSAWWFNDHYTGMKDQLRGFSEQGYLAGFVGMLTDSRSFISYARHEYFRRILCDFLGQLVEEGRYPKDMEKLKTIVQGICYLNAKTYFGF